MSLKEQKREILTLKDRVTRLEIIHLYRSVTHRLLQIYDEQRAQERIMHKGLDPALDLAVDSQAPRIFHAKDLAKRLKKSVKWIYAHAVELGGARSVALGFL